MAPGVAQAIPHHMTQQQSIPGSPLLQSPIPIPQHGTGTQIIYGTPTGIQVSQPLTQVQPGVYTVPAAAAPHATFDPGLSVSGNFVAMTSPTLRTPMSRLSYKGTDDGKFPDPATLEPAPASQVNMELFDRGLADPWNQYNNQIQQQVSFDPLPLSSRLSTSSPPYYFPHSLSSLPSLLRLPFFTLFPSLSLRVPSLPPLFLSLSSLSHSHIIPPYVYPPTD